ncbi:MAG TPA: glycosyltransferase [Solirubrobacteraceae bacterium]|nr:glycosyltransferase [Solirubrobacteraceae bacterium]
MPELSVVIPSLRPGRPLDRVLERLAQGDTAARIEIIVALDRLAPEYASPGPATLTRGDRSGASAARNAGWRAANAPLVLFLDDDVLPGERLIAEHLAWHRRHPEPRVAVLGHVRWAGELRPTPLMEWLDEGVQFDYGAVDGTEAKWWQLYSANVSLKRELLERAGGFDAERFPFGYEDLDLGRRLSDLGLRLLYNAPATAEHLSAPSLDEWRGRVRRIAAAERAFVTRYPELPPYFHNRFARELPGLRGRGLSARLQPLLPRGLPWVGARAWASARERAARELGAAFLDAWEDLAAAHPSSSR